MADGLVFDARNTLGDNPGLHVLLIGVSEYVNLVSSDEPEGEGFKALRKLESSALSAIRVMDKLIELEVADRLVRPLATVRLLIAPSQTELDVEPRLGTQGAQASLDDVEEALNAWRDDVARSRDNQAFFFFSGHGIRRGPEESIVLLADFLRARRPKLKYAFDTTNVRDGMAPSADFPDIGREQFYFIDACRDKPTDLDQLDSTASTKMFDVGLAGLDDRSAPIYFATVPGGQSYGAPGEMTFFTKALLWALEHGAVDKRRIPGVTQAVWPINADSLRLGIIAADALFATRVEMKGIVGSPALCFRNDPPEIHLKLQLAPELLSGAVDEVIMTELNSLTIHNILSNGTPGPFSKTVRAGMYKAKAQPPSDALERLESEVVSLSIQTQMPWIFDLAGTP